MDGTKKKAVSSSMIELKAELFRKQEEFNRQKASGSSFLKGAKTTKGTKGDLWSKQNSGVLARAEKDKDTKDRDSDDDDVHAKSKRALEEKARLYDKLCNSSVIPDEDGSDLYLVDFQKKVIDSIVEDREASRRKEEEEEQEIEKHALAAEIPEPLDPDEEWIDFKDSLGRDRRCMKKDLDQLMKQDRKLALAKSTNTIEISSVEGTSLMSSDMHREMMREKWESEMKELQEKGQEEIHYSNIQFDEIRSHGIGFFQFSKDHKTREEQLEDLKKIREETLDKHSHKERIKEKRKVMMEARLAKVRQRRNLKELPTEVKSQSDHNDWTVGPKPSEALLPPDTEDIIKKEELKKQAEEKRKAHIREWDKDKLKAIPNRKSYIENLRDEREQEFAPPSAYFEETKIREKHPPDSSSIKLPQSLFKSGTTTSYGNQQLFPANKSVMEKTAHKSNKPIEYLKTCNNSESKQLETTAEFDENSLSSTPQDQFPTYIIGNLDNCFGPQGYQTCQNYSDQTFKTQFDQGQAISSFSQQNKYQHVPQGQQHYTQQPQGQQHFTKPPQEQHSYLQQQQRYPQQPQGQHIYLQQQSEQGQQSYPEQSQEQQSYPLQHLSAQYTSSYAQPQQYNYFYGTDNRQFPDEVLSKTGLSSNLCAPHFNINTTAKTEVESQFTTTGESTESETADVPKRPKIPKMAIMDMRNVKNEEVTSLDILSASSTAVTAVPYTPGSFTAAKNFTVRQYEESVAESRLKNQISGTAVLYTAEQMKNQEQATIDLTSDKILQDFLSEIKSENK